ncbi:hypothetical protein C943_01185 [Mariniradius saccharolyticus AK6]|uniref:Glycosyl transferase family 2 n=1 Tax=Mariniradius saccharolyticus AK6 TaxID=1239962 RepID=M7XD08_9BACT|nr:glycosyltransferase family 2 protein [Mariniradius saccharolyticus]EMS32458.1 hypothetical protein C943_01185 [Mariniradius saccharolyticus AK6]
MKSICVITMARHDNFFLEKWIKYYGHQIGEEHLYIYLDGKDQDPPKHSGKANIIFCDKIPGPIGSAEPGRLAFLSKKAAHHLQQYDIVIGCDADEFLVVEPNLGKTLGEYLGNLKIRTTVSGVGLDVGQREGEEGQYDPSKGFLEQRSYAMIAPDYTKPCVITKPVTWGVGFHRIRGHNYHIDKNLYMFHFGCFDAKMIADRFKDKDRLSMGWEKHLNMRRRTIEAVSKHEAKDGNVWLPRAQFIQKWFRPPYKWNRPSMLNMEIIIRIPERFRNCI